MNWLSIIPIGFLATVVFTSIMFASQGLRWTRMSLPFMLGTMLTPRRQFAKGVGSGLHLLGGWAFAFVYAWLFETIQLVTWWLGGLFGLTHGLFMLTTALPMLPVVHPRMADEDQGPTPTRQLEPPGFLALNYGRRTPLVTLFAHMAYGLIVGVFYQLVQQG